MTGPQDPAAAGRNRLRAGHADREQVIETLKDAFVHGRAHQGRTRRAGGPGAHRADPRRPGRAHRRHHGRTGRRRAGAPACPGTPPAAGQGGHRVGPLPGHRGRRRTGRLPRRSRCPLHSLSGLGCPDDAPGLSRRRRGARHLGLRGGRLMGAQALPRAAAARAGARRPHPGRRTARRRRPGSGSPRPPRRPDPRRPARSQATAAHSRPGRPGTPRRAAGARRNLTPAKPARTGASPVAPDWAFTSSPHLIFPKTAHGYPARCPPGHGEGALPARKCPRKRRGPRSGRALRARLDLVREPAPPGRAEPQHRPGTVGRVTHQHAVAARADLYARAPAVAAVTGLAPARLYLDFHCSAISKMRDRDSSRGSALPRIRSNSMTALLTNGLFSEV